MSARAPLRLALLISGRGSNMEAVAHACADGSLPARIVRVLADRASAGGIERAQRLGLDWCVIAAEAFADRAAFEDALAREIDAGGAELVVLAGFMRVLSPAFTTRYRGRMLNIHPSVLPNYKGLHTHRRVLAAGEREHGASVHFVTAQLDDGPVICRARVPVLAGESEASLAARVLEQEHRILPLAIGLIASGRLQLRGNTIILDGRALATPIEAAGEDTTDAFRSQHESLRTGA